MAAQPVARLGDTSTHGGALITASPNVYANGIRVCRYGDILACPIHGHQPMVRVSTLVFANGLGVARIGDMAQCGALITTGSPNVVAG